MERLPPYRRGGRLPARGRCRPRGARLRVALALARLPFRKGYRKRLRAEFESVEEEGWRIRFHVEVQQVEDFSRSLEPRDQDWEDAGQDADLEARIMQKLIYRFRSDAPDT